MRRRGKERLLLDMDNPYSGPLCLEKDYQRFGLFYHQTQPQSFLWSKFTWVEGEVLKTMCLSLLTSYQRKRHTRRQEKLHLASVRWTECSCSLHADIFVERKFHQHLTKYWRAHWVSPSYPEDTCLSLHLTSQCDNTTSIPLMSVPDPSMQHCYFFF